MRMRWSVTGTVLLVALGLFLPSASVKAAHTASPVTIPILSAWGGTHPDVDVTYEIKAGAGVSPDVVSVVQSAINNWNTAIDQRESGWTFDLVLFTGIKPQKPDIKILIKQRGGVVRGTGVPKINPATGLITSCSVTISGQFAFLPPDTSDILITAWQELGHCFGLGHADQPEDPMCSGFGCANLAPTSDSVWHCDADAFVLAHHWLTSGALHEATGAHPPSTDGITSKTCTG